MWRWARFAGRAGLAPVLWRKAAYPSRTIKMIVPYPAGGTTDFLGRLVADQLKTGLGATVDRREQARGRHHARRGAGSEGRSPTATRC